LNSRSADQGAAAADALPSPAVLASVAGALAAAGSATGGATTASADVADDEAAPLFKRCCNLSNNLFFSFSIFCLSSSFFSSIYFINSVVFG
jgi:hypothetical protein